MADKSFLENFENIDFQNISLVDLVLLEDKVNSLSGLEDKDLLKIEAIKEKIAQKYGEFKNSPDIPDLRFTVHEIRTGYKPEDFRSWQEKPSIRENNGWSGNNGWKIHLDVVPNRNHPLTKEISDFLLNLDIEHKIARGGENGKGMTIYIGSYADTVRLSKEIQNRFGDRLNVPPAYTDQIGMETAFEKTVYGRFVPGAKRGLYPLTNIGIGLIDIPQTGDLINERIWGNATSDDTQRRIIESAYNHHKLYAKLLGSYYYGDDINAFEEKFFGNRLPPKGSEKRSQMDANAEIFENDLKTNDPKTYAFIQNLNKGYIAVDFSKLPAEKQNTEIVNSKMNNARRNPMAHRIYTRDDLQKYLDDQKTYLFDTTKSEDFANLHEAAIEDIEAFINGTLSITPDSYDTMETFIHNFAHYKKDPRMIALEAKAKAKLDEMKSQRIEERVNVQMPDLTKLNLHTRNSSETAAIIENEKNTLASVDDRFNFIFDSIISAYRTGDNIETLNDLIKTESDVKVAQAVQRAVEHNNADTVPSIQKEVIKYVLPQDNTQGVVPPANEGNTDSSSADSGNTDGSGQDEKNPDDRNPDNSNDGGEDSALIPLYGIVSFRERQSDNFDNEIAMHLIELEVLYAEGKITETELKETSDIFNALATMRTSSALSSTSEAERSKQLVSEEDERKAYAFIEQKRSEMKPHELQVHQTAIIDNLFNKLNTNEFADRYEQLVTPEILDTAIHSYELRANNKRLSEDEKGLAANRLKQAVEHGNVLVSDIAKQEDFHYADITNIADVYDGYTKLITTLSSKEQYKDEHINYEDAQEQLTKQIAPYDEQYNIPDGKHPVLTAERLVGRLNAATEVFDRLEFNISTLGEEFIAVASNFKFATEFDDNGHPIAFEECIKDGKVVEGSSLETLLKFAANDVMMQKLNTKEKITDKLLLEGAKTQAFATMFAYANAEETIQKGLRENPDKFTDPKYREAFIDSLKANQTTVLSPLAVKLAQNREANKVETFANRLKSLLGAQNTRYIAPKLIAQVSKIDKTSHYQDHTDQIKKKALMRQIGGVVASGAIAYGMSYGLTKLAAKYGLGALKANTLAAGGALGMSAELAVGTPKAAVYALGGAAAATLSYMAFKKLSALRQKQKYGLKEMKADMKTPQFASAVVAGACSGASIGYALSGCPKMAVTFGYLATSSAGIGRAVSAYRDMRLSGHKKGYAVAMAAVNAAIVPLAGHFGRLHGMSGQATERLTEVANEAQTKTFHNNPAEAAKEGWVETQRLDPAEEFYLVEHQEVGPYHNYSQEALDQALLREDGIRFSEFLNQGQGGLHVQPDYQNGLPGLMHDAQLHDNAIEALNKAASMRGNEWMNTLGADRATVTPNSEILFYKLYQQAVLHPKDSQVVDTFKSLLEGNIDSNGLSVIQSMEDKTSTLGHVLSDHNSYSYKTEIDPGYALDHSSRNIFARFAREHILQPLSAAGAMIFEGVRKVKDNLRPGSRDDMDIHERTIIGYQDKEDKTDKTDAAPINDKPVDEKPVDEKPVDEKPVDERPVDNQSKDAALIEEYKIVHGVEPSEAEKARYLLLVQAEYERAQACGATNAENLEDFLQTRINLFKLTVDEKTALSAKEIIESKKVTLTSMTDGTEVDPQNITLLHLGRVAELLKKEKSEKEKSEQEKSEKEKSEKAIMEEYKIVHGDQPSPSEFIRYMSLVSAEYRQDKNLGKTTASSFEEYVQNRVKQFKESYGDQYNERANTTRETMRKTNLSFEGKPLESKNVTMRHFSLLARVDKHAGKYSEVTAARDTKRAPTAQGKHDKPKNGTLELTTLTTSGQTKNKGKGQHTDGLPKSGGRSK